MVVLWMGKIKLDTIADTELMARLRVLDDAVTLTDETGKVLGEYVPMTQLEELNQPPHPNSLKGDSRARDFGPFKTLDEWKREYGWE